MYVCDHIHRRICNEYFYIFEDQKTLKKYVKAYLIIAGSSFFRQYLIPYGGGLRLERYDVSRGCFPCICCVDADGLILYYHYIR